MTNFEYIQSCTKEELVHLLCFEIVKYCSDCVASDDCYCGHRGFSTGLTTKEVIQKMSITLEEAIVHAEQQAIRNENEAKRKREYGGEFYDSEVQACLIYAEQHRQLAEWLKELQRARVLLKATHELLETTYKSPLLDALSIVVHYDGVDCDGSCLKEDIKNYFDEYGKGGDVE